MTEVPTRFWVKAVHFYAKKCTSVSPYMAKV